MLHLRTLCIAALCAVASSFPSWARAQASTAPTPAAPIPLEDFFRKARFAQVELSPSGRYLAAIIPINERRNIAVIDLDDVSKVSVITAFRESDVSRVFWVNDERLVYTLNDLQRPVGEQLGAGLFAVNRDAKEYRELSPVEMRDSKGDRARSLVYRGMRGFSDAYGSWKMICSARRCARIASASSAKSS